MLCRLARSAGLVATLAFVLLSIPTAAQRSASVISIAASSGADIRQWDGTLVRLERDGQLRVRREQRDELLPGASHVRLDQYYQGVRVFGGDIVRQTLGGQTRSVFGTLYEGIELDPEPALSPEDARSIVERDAGASVGPDRLPELVVLPRDEGGYALSYRLRVVGREGLMMYFVDARSGTLLLKYSDLKTQSSVGAGTGVLGDRKKVSVTTAGSVFRASDEMHPPALLTFDMAGNVSKTMRFLNGLLTLGVTDLASDSDNEWTDGASVDAHAYAGWVYDYYWKRFGRQGLDNRDIHIVSIVHPVRRDDVVFQPPSIVGMFYLNAGYVGDGVMIYGEGLPPHLVDSDGRRWNYTSGALDVVAHELTHGVTDYTSRLIYRNESGALNEAFSDVMGVSVEFYFQAAGEGPLHADYLMGEDVVTPGGLRSMADPGAYGDPDHYSVRYTGGEDNGGVHINSSIVNHVFYLAVEGGTHRRSGRRVQGVGGDNREQIEKVFYRAFTALLPSGATFAMARSATLQSARDLYGSGSGAERALADAWSAVGVE